MMIQNSDIFFQRAAARALSDCSNGISSDGLVYWLRQTAAVIARFERIWHTADIGNPFGVDLATMIFGAGISLLLSAGVMTYEDEVTGWTAPELLGAIGGIFIIVGTLVGIALVISGLR